MNKRWAPAFTIVELLIIITVVAILATLSIVGYNGIQSSAMHRAAQSELNRLSTEMQQVQLKTGSYPTTVPSSLTPSENITLSVVSADERPFYTNLSAIQQGVLISQICQDLIDEGIGKGVDQGGTTRDYVTGCGNWNDDSMQVTAWDTKKWDTPVSKSQLEQYITSYTVSNTYHKDAQEKAVKTFYRQLIVRHEAQGGSFPITSFWDYWATPSNGGVQLQPLESDPQVTPHYCAEAQANNDETIVWHVTENMKILPGSCTSTS